MAPARGLARTEIVAGGAALVVAAAVLAPVLGQAHRTGITFSAAGDLRTLHEAHACYARDWNDRQYTAIPDDFGVTGGDCHAYADEFGCVPPVYLGWSCGFTGFYRFALDCDALGGGGLCSGNLQVAVPLNFADPGSTVGSFRIPNVQAFNAYVNGRFYDPVFYSPLESFYPDVLPRLVQDCEFVAEPCLLPSSYVTSPAAMYHPEVFRAPSKGGFRAPGSFDEGFASPTVSQALYPNLKTRMIEHNWLEGAPGPAHPTFEDPFGPAQGCAIELRPYLFNHGADARPSTLFFDGSIKRLRTGDVTADDARLLRQTGTDGLWSRDTPLGPFGYFGDAAVDGTNTSHHVLTTGGIRGRDVLGGSR